MVRTVGEVFRTASTNREHTNGITETLHHHQAEPNQIQQSNMSRQNLLVQPLPGGVNRLDDLQSGVVVSQKDVNPGQGDQGEVTKELRGTELGLISIGFVDLANLGGVNLLGKGGEVRNHSDDIPDLLVGLHHLLFLSRAALGLASVVAEALKLVHKLINHVPKPHHGQFQRSSGGVEEVVEEVAVVFPRLELLLEGGLELGVDVTVEQLTVQHQKHLIVLNKGSDSTHSGPGGGLEVPLSQLLERNLVDRLNLRDVSIGQMHTEESNKVLDFFRESNSSLSSLSFSHYMKKCQKGGGVRWWVGGFEGGYREQGGELARATKKKGAPKILDPEIGSKKSSMMTSLSLFARVGSFFSGLWKEEEGVLSDLFLFFSKMTSHFADPKNALKRAEGWLSGGLICYVMLFECCFFYFFIFFFLVIVFFVLIFSSSQQFSHFFFIFFSSFSFSFCFSEHINVGDKTSALQTLHGILGTKRFMNKDKETQKTLERVMFKYLDLCIEMRRGKMAKDGLHQYKYVLKSSKFVALMKKKNTKIHTNIQTNSKIKSNQTKPD